MAYSSFQELADQGIEGRDYQIRIKVRDGPVLVMAPHGGKIEPGTTEIAEAIAESGYSFYSFEGLTMERDLHIESHLFDEPRALKVVDKAEIVVTVHGQLNREDEFVMVGGLDLTLGSEIKHRLEAAGFKTFPPTEGLRGTDPANICNRGKSKRGVQLEISRRIRDSLRVDQDRLQVFADAVRRAIQTNLESRSE